MRTTWSKSRIIYLVVGVICIGVGLYMILPGLTH